MTMLVPVLLGGYALAVASAAPRWLPRASWPLCRPRLGIAAWQALTVSFVASVLLAGLLIALPCLPDGVHLNLAAELRNHYSSAPGIIIGGTAAAASMALVGRLAWAALSAMATASRRRARHDQTLTLVGRPGRPRAWWSSTMTSPWCTACPDGAASWSPRERWAAWTTPSSRPSWPMSEPICPAATTCSSWRPGSCLPPFPASGSWPSPPTRPAPWPR